ncbi:MAG TPA: Gfo/Idh/MocA family oxidoreductase [Burkholderiales bacterium]|nr:Gfo/Idh/MocA family oxidoreductase [Burkholderiales bacterium]
MSAPLRVAAVGLGWVTLHRHLPALRRTRGVQVVGVVDRRPGHAAAVARRHGIARSHEGASLAAIPWLDEVDAFSIGTSPMAHARLIREALELGRHVVTEKPFVMDPAEGEALVALARARRRTLAIVHNFQFARSVRALARDLEDGRFGRIRFVSALQLGNPARRLPDWHEELPLGLFYDESPHLLYLLRSLAPAPLELRRAEVHASTLGKQTPAWISAHYVAGADAIPVKLNLAFEAPLSEWHVSIAGDRMLGDVDVFRDIYVRLPNDGAHTAWPVLRTSLAVTWTHWLGHLTSGPAHLAGTLLYGNDEVFRRFAEAARRGEEPAEIGAEDALAVLKMQHELIRRAERIGRGLGATAPAPA